MQATNTCLLRQDNLRLVAESRGIEAETYQQALKHIQSQCRENGIDAALTAITEEDQTVELDALLLCDRKGAGQQIAAQAGNLPTLVLLVLSYS